MGLGQGGLQIRWDRMDWGRWVYRLSGTGWHWDRGVFQLNQSACPKVEVQGRGRYLLGKAFDKFS